MHLCQCYFLVHLIHTDGLMGMPQCKEIIILIIIIQASIKSSRIYNMREYKLQNRKREMKNGFSN